MSEQITMLPVRLELPDWDELAKSIGVEGVKHVLRVDIAHDEVTVHAAESGREFRVHTAIYRRERGALHSYVLADSQVRTHDEWVGAFQSCERFASGPIQG